MIYFGQSRGSETVGVQLDVGSRVPIATSAMGRAYFWALDDEERAEVSRILREHYGSRWPKMRDGLERSGETVAKYGFAMSVGDWHDDIGAAGVALKLERRNRTLRIQLRRARIPLHGRAFDQRHWTASAGDGKEHRSGTRGTDAAIQKRSQQKAEIRRKSCACGRGVQIAFVITGSGSHRPFAH